VVALGRLGGAYGRESPGAEADSGAAGGERPEGGPGPVVEERQLKKMSRFDK